MESRDGGWGAFDADNVAGADPQAPVLRLRRGDRPAERRRHRARASRCSRGEGLAGHPAARRGDRVAAARAGGGRLVVRPLGLQLRLRHGRAPCPALVAAGIPPEHESDPPRRPLARAGAERRRRLGRGHALLRRPGRLERRAASRPRRRPPGRCSRCTRRASARARPSAGSPGSARRSSRTGPGTSPGTRAPASRATSTSTTTCTGSSSR